MSGESGERCYMKIIVEDMDSIKKRNCFQFPISLQYKLFCDIFGNKSHYFFKCSAVSVYIKIDRFG